MVIFQYSLISKFIFRYANIPLTIFLLLYLVSSFLYMFQKWYFVFPFLLNLLIIIALNRYYLRSYKLFPYKIEINNEKMICSDYLKKSKVHEILLRDIDSIEGGSLSGTPAKPIYINSYSNNVVIGISTHMKNYNKLITIILSNVKQEVYNEVLDKASEISESNKEMFGLMKSKKKPIKK